VLSSEEADLERVPRNVDAGSLPERANSSPPTAKERKFAKYSLAFSISPVSVDNPVRNLQPVTSEWPFFSAYHLRRNAADRARLLGMSPP
jgi:hypothetical protein